ncbi:uncharacterized protein L969DRAFT_382343 [Mixia osmundae IAM 14324]|uniref:Conserved oligomeric Golgi complex subunit 3 n=1 Tax=Mixia osmundae (strain CBS 9802 / IAM 14324 / JCM 22182 / KY 12970) TaxID=764103 RepID=G7E983_MIXOS|nr:uncharacterized protein L969DRAFT_382343 [Mixia osmundae IAM 14324]KEI39825.1 hypothetical protein L969DRAFT_382343 [Mixia osmundae IAM 14324]GAA99202.1 hypothetical protein E5Q_05895 [Mixia osmundae IAM 14324]
MAWDGDLALSFGVSSSPTQAQFNGRQSPAITVPPAPQQASTSKLSIEQWDKLAPLTDAQRASVAAIQRAAHRRPVPARLARAKAAEQASRPSTPLNAHHSSALSRTMSSTPASQSNAATPTGSPQTRSLSLLNPAQDGSTSSLLGLPAHQSIANPTQFNDWFAKIQSLMESETETIYRHHLEQLNEYAQTCLDISDRVKDIRGLVREMEANRKFVEENSRALQGACEVMLSDQKRLVQVTSAIGARLQYFKELESMQRLLNLPGETVVLQEGFVDTLRRGDVCLEFFKANADFRDASIYLIRFQQCMTRALTLIKMYFVNTLRRIGQDAAEKAAGKDLSEAALDTLLYAKFTQPALLEPLRALVFQLESRAASNPEEYQSLLQECYDTWSSIRSQLVGPVLKAEVKRMDPAKQDIIALTRTGCNYLRLICIQEWDLFKLYFPSSGEEQAYAYLEGLCDTLYDSLRPRVLHEPRLGALCELCTVLQALMALDLDYQDEAIDEQDISFQQPPRSARTDFLADVGFPLPALQRFDSDDAMSPMEGPRKQAHSGRDALRFSVLLQTILQDVQTKLVFRAQAILQSEVELFIPSASDLDFPDRLQGDEINSAGLSTEGKASSSEGALAFRLPSAEVQRSWYPTLQKTIWVLSKLHTFVNAAIFEDLAAEAVTLCRRSLQVGAEKIISRQGAHPLDGQLFSIRHLLILKDTVRSIDMVQVDRAMDFSSVTDALGSLLRNSSALFNPSSLFQLAAKGIPSFAETMRDAKTDLDFSLKTVCEDLISQASLSITVTLRNFLARCQAFSREQPNGVLREQDWASSGEVRRVHDQFVAEPDGLLAKAFRDITTHIARWLKDKRTLKVLLPPIQDEVLDIYASFFKFVKAEYDLETAQSLTSLETLRAQLSKLSGLESKR